MRIAIAFRTVLRPSCAFLLVALASCSTTEALDPNALGVTGTTSAQAAVASAAAAPVTIPAATGPIANASGLRMQFAPVVGATITAATPLARRLSLRASQRGMEIVAKTTGPTDFLVKGYMSAIGEGKETVVIFVWDIIGADGNRLHRIQGQERVAAVAGADPWQAVPGATMEQIADRTIDEIAGWSTAPRG